ncbi:ankyrin repeat domain-containing protein [Aeromicrobium sp. CTD01-1L150]|uniref:ankyrin repeat domain-containing protein n=1 Tax=Aeromicrobium sp. CTD01-1L150 TaxID=3341830 RepID=UPI0035C0E656
MRHRIVVLLSALVLAACTAPTPQESPKTSSPSPDSTAPPEPTPTPTQPAAPSAEEQARLDQRLRQAAWDDDVRTARRLIERGADVNAKDETVQSAYLIATSEGFLDLLDLTLQHGADVDDLDSFRGTGVIRAAERGHADVVGRLVTAGVDPDHVNRLGWVALHEALVFAKPERRQQYLDTVRVLVAAGADVTVRAERDGRSPAELAALHELAPQSNLVRRAARSGQAPRAEAERRLLRAAAEGDADTVALALRQGARLEVRDDHERTPLLLAVAGDHLGAARLLVHLGADPDAVDDRRDTPWLVTGVTGNVAMGRLLLHAGADLTMRNRFGGLSPIPASERGHVDYVRWVSGTDIDLDHVNDLGWTALLEAVVLGDGGQDHREIVRILLDAGADPAITDHHGRTALDLARSRGHTQMVAILQEA